MAKKATSRKKGSFARCVKAVSKHPGITDARAVCAAAKMRKPGGKKELAFSRKNPIATFTQGSQKAEIFQAGDGEFSVTLSSGERKTFKNYRAAQGWARLRLHEIANPKGVRVKVYKRGSAKKNPLDKAQQLFEEFHGFPSKEVLEFREQVHYHANLASIGPLVSMVVRNRYTGHAIKIKAPDPYKAAVEKVVFLTFTEDGRQMVLVGGDQSLPMDQFIGWFGLNEHDVRDHMLIGDIEQATYRTRKTFEDDGNADVDFFHDLGEEHSKGVLPSLIYKPRGPQIEVAGGRYFIAKPERDLGNVSPGIVG